MDRDSIPAEVVRTEPNLPQLPHYPDLELRAGVAAGWTLHRVPPWVADWADREPGELEGAELPGPLAALGGALAAVADQVALTGTAVEGYCVEFHDARGAERAVLVQAWDAGGSGERVLARLLEVTGTVQAQKRQAESVPYHNIVGSAPATREMIRRIEVYGPVDTPVLITGETGTGKELVASALHEVARESRPGAFQALNCAALSSELLESELFGHEKGAFTGAVRTHQGLFERAHRGTLFLDELGEMPLPAQAKLLRALETGTVERVGGEERLQVDVRVVGATNVPLEQAVAAGRFRADLYHRIAVLRIHVPPLRERQEDIPQLVDFFLDQLARKHGRRVVQITRQALTVLLSYTWPGNIRELRNALERLFVESTTGVIGWRAMEEWIKERTRLAGPTDTPPVEGPIPLALPGAAASPPPTGREAILEALEACRWNAAAAARRLGIHRATLYRQMKKHGIERPRGGG